MIALNSWHIWHPYTWKRYLSSKIWLRLVKIAWNSIVLRTKMRFMARVWLTFVIVFWEIFWWHHTYRIIVLFIHRCHWILSLPKRLYHTRVHITSLHVVIDKLRWCIVRIIALGARHWRISRILHKARRFPALVMLIRILIVHI